MIALERWPQRQDLFRAVRQNAQEIVILVDPRAEKLRQHRRVALVALFATLSVLTRLASPTLLAHQLPTFARANTRIIVLGDESSSITGNNIKLGIALVDVKGAANFRRRPVP